MAFNINELRSQLVFGGAKNSLFQVQISNPVTSIGDLKVPFMVKASALPASTLGMIEVPYFGRKVKIAGDRTFEDWNVTVINDEDFLIRTQWNSGAQLSIRTKATSRILDQRHRCNTNRQQLSNSFLKLALFFVNIQSMVCIQRVLLLSRWLGKQ